MPDRRFYRSRTNRMLAGVCDGLAAYLGIDPTLVRIIAVLLASRRWPAHRPALPRAVGRGA